MTDRRERLKKLTDSTLRMNKGLVLLCGLASLLVGLSGWGLHRMVEDQRNAVRLHFARLMENIAEQEAFLYAILQRNASGIPLKVSQTPLYLSEPLPNEGPNIYKGQELSFSMPFSVYINPESIAPREHKKILALGAQVASFYSAFWSAAYYQSPQVFVFNVPDHFDIAVPAAGQLRRAGQIQGGTFSQVMIDMLRQLHASNPQPLDSQVHWVSYASHIGNAPPTVLGYINIDVPASQLGIKGASSWMVVASLLNLSQINDVERITQWPIYDRFSLAAPNGERVIGTEQPQRDARDGLHLRSDGLVFKVSSQGAQPWSALYVVGFKSFINYAWWPLLGLLSLVSLSIGGSWAFNRWYKSRVVLPAHRAHESIAESEAFSRAIIDTAPTGLCVVRCEDHQILMENRTLQAWQQTGQLIATLDQKHLLHQPGETDLEIAGRYLHVGLVQARYQGEDVWICALHDVTRHVEDAAALETARYAADAANEAKTRFLATMSHEIRTPLYGVLGTLELLGLTALAPRQQAYLRTIQRSSATLFQLISDVLDVSKIEAGQMTIELQAFCPLELTEDTLRTYSAFARSKGLQLYACIDANLPDRVQGDPQRIRQILNNLLSNAIKFTDHGRVVVRVQVMENKAGSVELQWQVSDSGIGISQAQQTQLFDPFYQVRDATSEAGAGLGLAICRWLCELMDGQLRVVSEPGLGSSFSLSLTLACVDGQLSNCPAFSASAPLLYIQAPAPELAHHISQWLNRFGQQTRSLSPDLKHTASSSALLLDMLASGQESLWAGPRVTATAGGPNPPEYTDKGWTVDAHDIRAIAWAISYAQQGDNAPNEPTQTQQARRLDLNILIAEDNPINQAIIKEQLEALGCSVVASANGEQALHQWLPGLFDLVMTDINMPVMNGYELAKALRSNDPDLPILGITANALHDEGERCLAAGMNAWLVKPLTLHTLRAQLSKYCQPAAPSHTAALSDHADAAHEHALPQLSPKMRTLFISTLQQDIEKLRTLLNGNDATGTAHTLHSMAGALGAVQALELSDTCIALENQLAGQVITPALIQEIETMLDQLRTMLDALQSSDRT
ncbi:ATP-binding protein [Pseudomonas orientalis]|uniref:hybrid sensor histidine kinase/response regulator n=1 Tax=Pseudomonas orientalis TaxID=76758 RepID=UPI001FAF495A|nr:hybrid sensor histidine kinase/response regulator [Pseudomonas orientalis]UOB22175.1 ATP-binding protein [Pseudomonas orientalis]